MDRSGQARAMRPAAGEESTLQALGRQLALSVVAGDPALLARGEDDLLKQAARETLATVERAAGVFRENEARAHKLAQRAIQELAGANERIHALEARALKAEMRAKEAERCLLRLQKSIEETLGEWRAAARDEVLDPAA